MLDALNCISSALPVSPSLPPEPPTETPARLRLLARIRRRYQTVQQPLRFGRLELLFTRVADPDRVLDEVAEEEDRLERLSGRRTAEDALHLPYWAELWDSAIAMGAFLAQHREHIPPTTIAASAPSSSPTPLARGPQVLDLGCGMGLSGTVAAALGGRVLLADIEPPALLFARLNSLPYARRVRTRRLNWRTDQLKERFNTILGADILYERKQWDYLEPFWRAHLHAGGEVLLGEPGRQTGDQFPDWITPRGWTIEHFEQPVPSRPRPVRILRLTRRDEKSEVGGQSSDARGQADL